jgi:hypothetical protein
MKYAVVSGLPDKLQSSLAANEIVESIGVSFCRSEYWQNGGHLES